MRLLIAEDDQKLLKSLLYIFEHNRYVVDGVSTGMKRWLTHCPGI